MMKRQIVLLTLSVLLSLLFTGCYTRLASIEGDDPRTFQPPDSVQSRIAGKSDTLYIRDREYCYWERNWFGNWELRCRRSYYPPDWFSYHNSPWWYRHDPFRFDYIRCPRYYYYDPACNCCRYYRSSPDYGAPPDNGDTPSPPPSGQRPGPGRRPPSRSYGVPRQRGEPEQTPQQRNPKSEESSSDRGESQQEGQQKQKDDKTEKKRPRRNPRSW